MYNGVEFQVGKNAKLAGNSIILYFEMEALGFGGIYAAQKNLIDQEFLDFVEKMNVTKLWDLCKSFFR